MSTRLSDRVIVKQWSESECLHKVKQSRTFYKAQAWGVLLPTPYGRCLTEVRQILVSRHNPKMLTIGVIGMHYPRNMQYLGYKIMGNYNMCTSKCHGKLRYRDIDTMYIRVELLYKHDGTPQGSLTKRFLGPSSNDSKERSFSKVRQNNMALRMNATFLKVLKEVLLGLPIMEPNVKRGNEIRRRRFETKRVPSWTGLTRFGCHAQSI